MSFLRTLLIGICGIFLNNHSISSDKTTCFGTNINSWNNCFGTAFYEKGKYQGEFKNGLKHGQGVVTYKNGQIHKGEYKNDQPNGRGVQLFPNGAKFEGEFQNGKYNGKGIFTYENGNKYVGEFKNNRRHGQGIYTIKNGGEYIGEYKNGQRNGMGVSIFPNGSKYEGEFVNGKYNGEGVYTFANGNKYEGEFVNGKYNGEGIFTFSSGKIKQGIWKDNKFLENKLISQYQDRAWLGVYIQQVTNEIAKSLGLKSTTGILVSKTNKDGPAFKYGIKPGDILLEFNGKKLKKIIDLPEFVKNSSVGETINFLILRNRKILNINVVLGKLVSNKIAKSQRPVEKTFIKKEKRIALERKVENEERKLKALEKEIAELKQKNKELQQPKKIKQKSSHEIGSGFYVSKFRHIVTNQHVVNQCKKITVGDSMSTQIPADLIASDKRNDLAILQTVSMDMASADTKSFVRKLAIEIVPVLSGGLMRSEDVVGGEEIFVAGFPLANQISDSLKLSNGIVSSTKGYENDVSKFEITSVVRKGNSGGPIYDKKGNIVGVVVEQVNVSRSDNVNFAIKGSTVKQFLSAHNVPNKWSNRQDKIDTKDIYKIASKQTVMVVCHR